MKIIEDMKAAYAVATQGEMSEGDFPTTETVRNPECWMELDVGNHAGALIAVAQFEGEEHNPKCRALIDLTILLHNHSATLIECAEALNSLMDLHTLDEEGQPLSRWYLESTKESLVVNARAALAKLENAK